MISSLRLIRPCRWQTLQFRNYSNKSGAEDEDVSQEIETLFSKPSWSVRSLLPAQDADLKDVKPITTAQLQHLLTLSAFKQLKEGPAQTKMLKDLNDQLHFVKQAQDVDTEGIAPLQNLTTDQLEDEELTYDSAFATGQKMKKQKFRPAVDYTKLSRRTKNRYFTVDGGLINKTKDE